MVTFDQRLCPHPEVVDTELEGQETVLLHLEHKTYYSLNLTGTRIWQGLKQHRSLRAISQQLQAEFDVTSEQADQSMLALLEALSHHQLVHLLEG